MITYKLSHAVLKTFADAGKDFLTFDQFVTIVQWWRDVHMAPDYVPGFSDDIGKVYNVWTRTAVSSYHRHIFPDELCNDLTISFCIPHLMRASYIPLEVEIFDEDGTYFRHQQRLAFERMVGGRFVLTSWKKIPSVAKFAYAAVGRG